ncbi:hypothetical protein Ancab_011558 [Ancistrocladus abbreviatus]
MAIVNPSGHELEKRFDKALTYLEDRISDLPNDVLISILSRLPLVGVAETGILSHRWRYLWRFTSNLDFDKMSTLCDIRFGLSSNSIEFERKKFVNWVNQVLELHQASTIDAFRVCFDLDGFDVSGWLDRKRVKMLQLNFTHCGQWYYSGNRYALRTNVLTKHRLDSLTCLCLKFVEVTGKVVEEILLKCPNLEALSVVESESLKNLKVPGPLLKLKRLEIRCCRQMTHIEISAINLVSLIYCGPWPSICFSNVPRLVEVSLMSGAAYFLVNNAFCYSAYLSVLEKLVLHLESVGYFRFPRFPVLGNLKHLELMLDAWQVNTLFGSASLLLEAPLLHTFVLKLWRNEKVAGTWPKRRKPRYKHQSFKVLEFCGFSGCDVDIALAVFIAGHAVLLEKMIIDPRNPELLEDCWGWDGWGWNYPEDYRRWQHPEDYRKDVEAARCHARQLEDKLPPQVQLVIL